MPLADDLERGATRGRMRMWSAVDRKPRFSLAGSGFHSDQQELFPCPNITRFSKFQHHPIKVPTSSDQRLFSLNTDKWNAKPVGPQHDSIPGKRLRVDEKSCRHRTISWVAQAQRSPAEFAETHTLSPFPLPIRAAERIHSSYRLFKSSICQAKS